jgi:hypothetical protein
MTASAKSAGSPGAAGAGTGTAAEAFRDAVEDATTGGAHGAADDPSAAPPAVPGTTTVSDPSAGAKDPAPAAVTGGVPDAAGARSSAPPAAVVDLTTGGPGPGGATDGSPGPTGSPGAVVAAAATGRTTGGRDLGIGPGPTGGVAGAGAVMVTAVGVTAREGQSGRATRTGPSTAATVTAVRDFAGAPRAFRVVASGGTASRVAAPEVGAAVPAATRAVLRRAGFTLARDGSYAACLAEAEGGWFVERWTLGGPEAYPVPLPGAQPEEPGTAVAPLPDGRVLVLRRVADRYDAVLLYPTGPGTGELALGSLAGAEVRLLPPSPVPGTAFALVYAEGVSTVYQLLGTGEAAPVPVTTVAGRCTGGVWLDREGRLLALDREVDGRAKAVAVDLHGGATSTLLQLTDDSDDRLVLAEPDSGLLLLRSDAAGESRLGWGVLGSTRPVRFPDTLCVPGLQLSPVAAQPGQILSPESVVVALRAEAPGGAEALALWRPGERHVHWRAAPAGWLSGAALWLPGTDLRLPCAAPEPGLMRYDTPPTDPDDPGPLATPTTPATAPRAPRGQATPPPSAEPSVPGDHPAAAEPPALGRTTTPAPAANVDHAAAAVHAPPDGRPATTAHTPPADAEPVTVPAAAAPTSPEPAFPSAATPGDSATPPPHADPAALGGHAAPPEPPASGGQFVGGAGAAGPVGVGPRVVRGTGRGKVVRRAAAVMPLRLAPLPAAVSGSPA